MKKKPHHHPHKFKPLIELYSFDHDSSVNHPKVDSECVNKCVKIFSNWNSVKSDLLENNTCAVLRPSCKQLSCTDSEMEKPVVASSGLILEDMSVDQTAVDASSLHRKAGKQKDMEFHKPNFPSAVSCDGPYSEDVHSLDSSNASGVTDDLKQNASISQTEEHKNQDGCDSHGSSYISKDNGVIMTICGHIGGEDHRAVTCTAASVSSSCPEIVKKYFDGHSPVAGSGDHMSHEEGNKSSISMQDYVNDPALAFKDSADKSNPSETSSCRHDLEGSSSPKDVASQCSKEQMDILAAKVVDPNVLCNSLLKPETKLCAANTTATDSSNKSDGHEPLKSDAPIEQTQEVPLQSQNLTQSGGLDELVDVRVCDTCGDAGREALLALCSKCSDGAEHIYCMRIKLEKVPESGWMCEECMGMQELKGARQVVMRRSDSALSSSCLGQLKQSLSSISSGVNQVGETSKIQLSRASSLSGKRPGPSAEIRSVPRKRTFEKNDHPPKSPHHDAKTRLTQMSSVNSMSKGQPAALQVSSFGDKLSKTAFGSADSSGDTSPRPKKRFCNGLFYKRKREDFSELHKKVKQSKVDVSPKRDTITESVENKPGKAYPKKKLFKSLSFAGVSSVRPEVSNHPSASALRNKGLKCGSGRNLTEKLYVPEKKANRVALSSTGSASMKICSSRTNMVSEVTEARPSLNKKAIQISGPPKIESPSSIARERKKFANLSGQLVREKSSTNPSGGVVRRPENANCYPDRKSSQVTSKGELNDATEQEDGRLVSSGIAGQTKPHPVKSVPMLAAEIVPSDVSAVPAAECIWMGAFELNESGQLPTRCSGVQAHLSTCASSEVQEVVSKFGPNLCFNVVPRSQTWPIQIQKNFPTEQDIAFYFFAKDLHSYGRSYKKLLDGLSQKDLVLEANFDEVQLLVFPSSLLPEMSQRWNSLSFLWGVSRARKLDSHSSHNSGLDVTTSNHELSASIASGSLNKCGIPLEGESPCASQKSDKPFVPELVNPPVLQLTTFAKSMVRNLEHEVIPMKCPAEQEENYVQPDTIKSSRIVKHETVSDGASIDAKLNATQDDYQELTSIGKTDVFPRGQLKGETVVSFAADSGGIGSNPDGSCKGPNIPWIPDPVSEFCPWSGGTHRSSISFDSGPSGSSNGLAKSDEVHGEQLDNPSSSGAVNLDLCLASASTSEPDVDLDLVLGFPSQYQMKHCTKSRGYGDENVSLSLSLGLPCSNA